MTIFRQSQIAVSYRERKKIKKQKERKDHTFILYLAVKSMHIIEE